MKPLPREAVLLLQTEGDQRLEVLPPLVQAERKSTTDKAPLRLISSVRLVFLREIPVLHIMWEIQ